MEQEIKIKDTEKGIIKTLVSQGKTACDIKEYFVHIFRVGKLIKVSLRPGQQPNATR